PCIPQGRGWQPSCGAARRVEEGSGGSGGAGSSDGERFYITPAIDYANGAPHMGHAIEKVGADAMARYRRLRGDDVHFLMGMDEHGLKVLQSADAAGTSPQEWVDDIAGQFTSAWERLNISFDDFVRTTQSRHR